MKHLALLFLVIVVAGGVYYASQNSKTSPNTSSSPKEQTKSSKITAAQAVENVRKLPEVQDYLKRVPSGRVEIDNEDEKIYHVHIYEIKNNHTATFNWYEIDKQSGEMKTL